MKNLLITGGSGYIGSHTVLELAKSGKYALTVFDDFKNGNKEALRRIEESTGQEIAVIEGTLLNTQDIESALSENTFDGVVHFAALIEAGLSVVDPLTFYENNTAGTLNLLMAMQKHSVQNIVFSSTAAVYGTQEETLVTEQSPINYDNPYGASKYFVEEMLRSLTNENIPEEQRINSIILRYFNAAGANPEGLIGQDYPKPTHLITVAIEAALGLREKLTIFGNDYDTPDGTCVRDYIHVQDLAKAHVKALEHLTHFTGSAVFNLGTGTGTSNLEIVKMLEEIHGEFNWEFGAKRPGDPAAYYANATKAEQTLGWKAELSAKDAVRDAYEWKKENPGGF